ncbi:unnamed protein product [Owenia fusiformis]|uniref:Uncharacterized protein n=1 Tax=Owenia fusiformis TaxID=6347 RepID=A0A8J1XXS1_OWEFU|nr:unnamed protein product [Owenia fusiformis]
MWNDVDVDFGGDETGNFGPRKETGSALYQIDTIATISSQEEVEHNPRVFATAREDGLCVSAGNNLSIFGQCGHDFLVTIDFGADIDVLEWSCDSQFIVAGTSNGRLHFVDIERQKILFSKDLVPASEIIESKAFQRIVFTLSTTHTSSNLLILTSSGKIVRITHIDLTAIREAKSGKDAAIIMQQLKIEKVDTSEAHDDKVSSADVLESHRLVITAGRGDAVLSSWRFDGIEGAIHQAVSGFITNGVGVKKCRLTQGGKYLITLQNDYSVGIWNTGSLSMFMQYSDLQVEDFALIETGDKTYRLCDTKIVLLTSASAGGQQLHVCTMPSFKSVYCIELSENTYLAEFPSNTENIYVVEGVSDEEGNSDLISTLRLRCLSEAMPDTRLNRILHKKQFNEAEQFAKQFGLDVELVYKVHTSHLLDDLSPWNVGDLDEGEIEAKHATLKTCLALISDDNHVIDCCIKAAMPTFQATLELLKYARERLNKKINAKDYDIEEDEISRPALLTKVLETIHRLTTYKIAFGEDEFTGSAWDHFMKANMLQELLQWLSRGEAHIAFTIWQHHQSEFIPVLDCDVVEDILRCIPETASSVSIKAWFTSDFIPFVIRNLPSALYIVAKFVEKRARTMELNEKKDWPQNALSMAECFHNTCLGTSEATSIQGLATIGEFVTQICNMSIGYTVSKTEKLLDSANKERTEEDSLKVESKVFLSLQRLIMNLRDLLSLHTKYNCKLSLAEYIQETTESLTYRMLDRVNAIQLIPSALEKVVKPYMKEHHLDEDKMLYQYIQDLLERFRTVSLYRGDSHWEAKAIAVIHCIKEPEYKCLSILLAMKQAYIPLSSDMDALVQEGLQLNIPRVVELKEQCKLMSLREILANYGLRNYPMGDVSRSERLVMYILHQDRPECLKDALEVVKAYNNLSDITAYIFRLNFLIKNNRILEAMELLRSLPTGQALICGSRVVSGTLILLNTHWTLYEDEKLERILFMEASIKILKALYTLDKNNDVVQEYYQYLPDLQRILALQVEFGEFMRLEDYCTEENRKSLLFKRLQLHFSGKQTPLEKAQHIDSDRKSSKSKTSGYAKIFRLANILRVSNDELRGQLAIHTARNEDVQTALKFCR